MQYGIENLAERKGYFIGGIVDSVRDVVNKVVPRELKPILPVATAAFLGPVVGNMFSSLGPAAAGFLGAGTTSALTQALTGSGKIDPMSTLLSAGIGGIQGARVPQSFRGTEKINIPVKSPGEASITTGPSGYPQIVEASGVLPNVPTAQSPITFTPGTEAYNQAMENAGFFDKALMTAKEYVGSTSLDPTTGRLQYDRGPESLLKGATGFSLPYTAKAAAEEQIDLEEQERQAGIESAAQKRKDKKIYIDFVMRAGFTREEAERMADGAGYDEGGKVMLASDPDPADERNTMRENFAPRLFKGRTLDQLSDDEIIELDEAILEMTKKEKKEERVKASNGLGVLMDIFNAGNQRMETGDYAFPPLERPLVAEEDLPTELDLRESTLEFAIEELLDAGYEANKEEIERYAEELRRIKVQQAAVKDPTKRTLGRAEGGKVLGLPPGKQVDAREGMFIPMGGAKRADDVPAMLSVNEFVLNDNAVAGLGKMLTGTPDPRAGARALYKIQDQLEAMVV